MSDRQWQVAPGVYITEQSERDWQVAPAVYVSETVEEDAVNRRRRLLLACGG